AGEGLGARLNGARIHAGGRDIFPGARVPSDALPKADRDLVAVEKPNSIALRMAMVADDRADLVATLRWGNEWDIAAATLIAAEAGAATSDAFGAPLTFNKPDPRAFGVIVSTPGIHAAAVERLRERAEAIVAEGR
ncbi:MAG: inositol monophosphatase family protein, partial [Sphingomonas bacterium]